MVGLETPYSQIECNTYSSHKNVPWHDACINDKWPSLLGNVKQNAYDKGKHLAWNDSFCCANGVDQGHSPSPTF